MVPREGCPARGASPSRIWGVWEGLGIREGCTRAGASGLGRRHQKADRQERKGEGEWPVAPPPLPGVRETNTYLLRGPVAAPGRLGEALFPGGLWRALAASGEARWAPTWSGMVTPLQTEVTAPTSPEPSCPVPRPVWDSRKETFSGFFFPPFLPNFGAGPAP